MIAIVTAPELAQDVAGAELLLSRHAEHRVEIGSRSDALLAFYKTGNTLISQVHNFQLYFSNKEFLLIERRYIAFITYCLVTIIGSAGTTLSVL